MFYDNYDFEFLRLCGLCRYIPADLPERYDSPIFCKGIIAYMQRYKLIKMQSDKMSYKLTERGRQLLLDMGYMYKQDARMNINRKGYKRKIDSAKLTILMHHAGINVFCENLSNLNESEVGYVVKAELYNEYNQKSLAGTRFLGLLKIYDTVYVPYYVEGYDDWIIPNYEREIFMELIRELSGISDVKVMLVKDELINLYYHTIYYKPPEQILERGKEYFKDALGKLGMDIVWVPLNKDGILQMNIMTIPNHKERIVRALGATEPPLEYNLCDAIHANGPTIVLLDMNIKSKIPAIRQALEVNTEKKAILVCMLSQKETAMKYLRYIDEDCFVFGITKEDFVRVFKDDIKVFKQEPFIKGGKMFEVIPPWCRPEESEE